MPRVFKSLATVVVWVLFIFGLLRLVIGLANAFTSGPDTPELATYIDFAVAITSLMLSVVAMKIRKSLE